MSENFTQTGGARLDLYNATWPMAKFSASPAEIRLSVTGENFVFTRENITALNKHIGFFSVGLHIEHTEASYPKFIVYWSSIFFWSSSFKKLVANLERLGYQVN